jgi:solute:Na+ symporter, SSS family
MVTWIIFEVLDTTWPSLIPATVVSLIAMVVGSMVWPQHEIEYDQNRAE